MSKKQLSDVRAITFDGDGTLWDFDTAMRDALIDAATLLNDAGLQFEGYSISANFLRDVRDEVAAWPIHTSASMETIRLASFAESVARCGVQDSNLVQRVYDIYMHARLARLRLFPDASSVLRHLHGRYKLALVTNGNTHPRSVGVEQLLDAIVIAAEVGYRKPDPMIYHFTLRQLGVSATRAVHVGDHLHEDVQAAKDIGMRAVWLDRKAEAQGGIEADAVIGSLNELPGLLER